MWFNLMAQVKLYLLGDTYVLRGQASKGLG